MSSEGEYMKQSEMIQQQGRENEASLNVFCFKWY
jgi:hypothetical protein